MRSINDELDAVMLHNSDSERYNSKHKTDNKSDEPVRHEEDYPYN